MNSDHEYSVLGGPNRANIGHTLSMIAALASSTILTAFLAIITLSKKLGWIHDVPSVIIWPLSAGLVYAAIYWIFEKHVWKLPVISRFLRVPNLSGVWHCEGKSLDAESPESSEWSGEVTIVQSWDRLTIRVKTKTSSSISIAAALVSDEAEGFRLLYNYVNTPTQMERELTAHRGCAEIVFEKSLKAAAGEYFNGHGRYTFGTMKLTRPE